MCGQYSPCFDFSMGLTIGCSHLEYIGRRGHIEYKALITAAQENDWESEEALTDILMDISDHHMDRSLRKYIDKATVGAMDADDLRQTFLIGCSEAIATADSDIGDPLAFILQKGKWKVIDALRGAYRRDLRQTCDQCGNETIIYERGGVPICRKCGAEGYQYIERYSRIEGDDAALLTATNGQISVQDIVIAKTLVEAFRDTLEGRKKDVFDLLINGYDRESCQNYTKEIGEVLGVSTANVGKRMRQIRESWSEWLSTQRLDESA